MITVLAGGTGSIKIIRGFASGPGDEEIRIVSNVGDNIWLHGLYICPDIDIVMYGLAGILSERGWGIKGDTFSCLAQMERIGEEIWFKLGDKDLATHLLRTSLRRKGRTLTDPGMPELIDTINSDIRTQKGSPVTIENATLGYTGSIKGSSDKIQLSYKVVLEGILSSIVLDTTEQGSVLDLDWRSVIVDEPLPVIAPQNGNMSVNYPIGLLEVTYPGVAQGLLDSESAALMKEPLFNFQDMGIPMDRWHFLFDPTGSQAGSAGSGFEEIGGARVVSIYSIGESSFREGTFSERVTQASASINGTQAEVESSTPPPSGQIQIAGFSRIEKSGDNELAFVTAQAPEGTVTATGGFPIQVLLILGGMMGAVAVFVLLKTRK